MNLKEQILMTAFNLFSQYGIKSVSMDDIAGTVSISKRTLYGFFDDKESLLIEGLNSVYNKMCSYILKVDDEQQTSIDIIVLMYEEFLKRPPMISSKFYDDLKKYPKASEVRRNGRCRLSEISMSLYNRGVKEGVFMPDINFNIIALLVKEQLKITGTPGSFFQHSNTEIYDTILITFLRGISTDKGRTVLKRWINARTHNIQ